MTNTAEISKQLLEKKIVSFKESGHYEFASGIHSPIYTDLRQTISYPALRKQITKALAKQIQDMYPEVTVIAGVATAGIPQAALVAEEMNLPMVYVRSKPKDHGKGKQIEGVLNDDDQVVLIDDLLSTGGSVLKAAQAVTKEGYQVAGISAIFSYGFTDLKKNMDEAGFAYGTILNYQDLLSAAHEGNWLSDEHLESYKAFQSDPWGFDR
ncbi:orotate phosphoribosyltransferase [Fructobacillus sp. M2-14]|uniref:Orotate phosphoribosyltransferase n=1 Tax=Fructobacillus broussonetiae TaxID=2713173 RepID=A0ABS5QZC7_9LACO|nr:orotate phosphoribosyltransferase [Fructobacillus broussonetiae]MBS9338132.1 orotate phosphoribosyltransferase [Fructobacillus broussonetiae]